MRSGSYLSRGLRLVLMGAFILSAAACASIQAAPSVMDEGQSPRKTTVAAIETTIGIFDKLTMASVVGALPDNFLDDVVQFSPEVESRAVAYLDATAACVVIDGALQTDPATGRVCEKLAVVRAFGGLSDIIAEAINRVGPKTDTGRALLVASLFLDRQLQPSSGDIWSGYEKRPDLTLEDFDAARVALRASFERFVTAAKTALATPAVG